MTVGIDEIAKFYDGMLPVMEKYHLIPNGRLIEATKMLGSIIVPGMKILDIGCGTGYTSKYMAERGAIVTAVDISPKLINFAKEHCSHENITYVDGDICGMSLEEKYDVISMVDVLEHIKPEWVPYLIKKITEATSKESLIHLNIPDANFINFLRDKHPEKLQIIDEDYLISELIDEFSMFGFNPGHIRIYGLDVEVQYNEIIFIKQEMIYAEYENWASKTYK